MIFGLYDRCFRIIDVHRREVRRHDEREIEEICVSSRELVREKNILRILLTLFIYNVDKYLVPSLDPVITSCPLIKYRPIS